MVKEKNKEKEPILCAFEPLGMRNLSAIVYLFNLFCPKRRFRQRAIFMNTGTIARYRPEFVRTIVKGRILSDGREMVQFLLFQKVGAK